ncbi:MAG: DUF615 domain-containing protein [Gammaproteobacteria bacterium]|nr:MAG: DUF615 domain-containing protein [Gammaproteobacteria bacterium]
MNHDDNDDFEEYEGPSKSQIKRECHALQDVGEELIKLKPSELDELDLPEILYNAIQEAHRIHHRSALKRHRQYIGKLMRELDGEHIAQQLHKLQHKHDLNNALFKRLENWREQILEQGESAISDFIDQYPRTDRQHLRQLYRNALKEKELNKPPAAARSLFKYLREIAENAE